MHPAHRPLFPALLSSVAFTALAATAAAAPVPGTAAQTQTRAECEQVHQPSVGQSGKDVIWIPTPDELVTRMLQMARVTPQDFVVDLGAGDGKIAIAAAREFGARAKGIEYDQHMVELAQCLARAEGVSDRVQFVRGDIFVEDFSNATVVTMYLLPTLNMRLRPTLLDMKPGTRVVSHAFELGDWSPDETATVDGRSAYLWIVPAKVEGTWRLRKSEGLQAEGDEAVTVRLTQEFQKVMGQAELAGGRPVDLVELSLVGDRLEFGYRDARGRAHRVVATVRGDLLSGSITSVGRQRAIVGSRHNAAPAAAAPAAAAPAIAPAAATGTR